MSHQDEKHRAERNILRSPDLELEMSGIEERGLRTPQTRLPGKTHVSAVILMANPWETRNFDRKMKELKKLQVQKDRQHFWAQRQFLMTHAFDSDMNLRFANLKLHGDADDDDDGKKKKNKKSGVKKDKNKEKSAKGRRKDKRAGLGEDEVEADEGTEEGGGPEKDRGAEGGDGPEKDRGAEGGDGPEKDRGAEGDGPEKDRGTEGGDGPEENEEAEGGDVVSDPQTTSEESLIKDQSEDERKSKKSHGLFAPPLQNHRKATERSKPKSRTTKVERGLDKEGTLDSGKPRSGERLKLRQASGSVSGKSRGMGGDMYGEEGEGKDWGEWRDGDGPLCDPQVIMNLTQTLPSEMMLKANANLNGGADEEKARQLEESRALSERDALSDERWLRLIDTLQEPKL